MSDTLLVADPQPVPAPVPATAPAKRKESALWREIKGLFWVLLAVLLFHSFVAKPFYIPSESMMPALLKGDRLVVSKYAYVWSWVSPSFHLSPQFEGRLFGRLPTQGDIVIVTIPLFLATLIDVAHTVRCRGEPKKPVRWRTKT